MGEITIRQGRKEDLPRVLELIKELAEYARTTDYDLLQPSQVVAALRKHSSIQGALSGGTWTIGRP